MASVNASRDALEGNVDHAVAGAKLIGFNHGKACVWYGGYSFNVYDAARNWGETNHFTSGEIAGLKNKTGEHAKELAAKRMESEGFTLVE